MSYGLQIMVADTVELIAVYVDVLNVKKVKSNICPQTTNKVKVCVKLD